ncbi:hypothetical protein NESM_000697400 [Novymonas esmeraldas]|uniref:Uncharacterized protein n=1 Tax=Novymonas esmeraldas TaxID=1808958 RepID=A0AAW0EVN3_9TRYP
MNDYAAWRSRALRSTHRSPSPVHDALLSGSAGQVPPPLPTAPHPVEDTTGCAPPLPSLVGFGDDPADAVARLQEVLHDIAATERREGRTWLNVQPCVLHAVKLLTTTAQSHAARVQQLEVLQRQLEQYTAVLVRDREVKEERYRLDAAAHREEREALWSRVRYLETQQQQQTLSQQPGEPLEAGLKAWCDAAVDARVAPLQQELRQVQRRLQATTSPSRPYRPARTRHRHPNGNGATVSDASTITVCEEPLHHGTRASRHRGRASGGAASCSAPSSSAASRSASSPSSSSASSVDGASAPPRNAASPGAGRMMREVQRLRRQWRHFLQTVPAAVATDSGHHARRSRRSHDRHSSVPLGNRTAQRGDPARRARMEEEEDEEEEEEEMGGRSSCLEQVERRPPAALTSALPASGRRVRWYWSGDSHSHFSDAVRRDDQLDGCVHPALRGASPALRWSACHAFDGRTDCWYDLGTWATHRRHLRAVAQAEHDSASGDSRLGRMTWTMSLVSWPDPATMVVERAGIYAVRACLVRHCASASLCGGAGRAGPVSAERDCGGRSGGAMTLWVNGVAVSGVREAVAHTLLYAHAPSSTTRVASPCRASAGRTRAAGSPPFRSSSAVGIRSPVLRRDRGDGADAGQLRRPCCEPAQLHTNTLATTLFLPAGAALQVRCCGLSDTKAVHEAVLELEFVV